MRINQIETNRLIIREFEKEDALWAYSIWNNPEMGEFLPDEAKTGLDEKYIKTLEALGEDKECCYLIPVFKDTLERVGTCSFIMSVDTTKSENYIGYDLAYCIHKKYWNNGYATEIVNALIDYARINGAKGITILINPDNIASVKVALKCGAKKVSESTYTKKGTNQIKIEHKYELAL